MVVPPSIPARVVPFKKRRIYAVQAPESRYGFAALWQIYLHERLS
jgi:hypothetical protein